MDDRVDSDGALVLLLTANDFDFNLDDKKKDDGKMHVIFGKGVGICICICIHIRIRTLTWCNAHVGFHLKTIIAWERRASSLK